MTEKKEVKRVSDHASADTPDTEVVNTNVGAGQPVENAKERSGKKVTVVNDAGKVDRAEQEEHLRNLGVIRGDDDSKKK